MLKIGKFKIITCIIFVLTVLYFGLGVLYTTYNNSEAKMYMPKLNLGLDLRGGASLLLDVNDEEYFTEYLHSLADKVTKECEKKHLNILKQSINAKNGYFSIKYQGHSGETQLNAQGAKKSGELSQGDAAEKNKASIYQSSATLDADAMLRVLSKQLNNYISENDYELLITAMPGSVAMHGEANERNYPDHPSANEKLNKPSTTADSRLIFEFTFQLKPNFIKTIRTNLLQQSIQIVRRRIDESGTREINLQRQGDRYILLEVPGINDTDQIKKLLGTTAKLSFHLVDQSVSQADIRSNRMPIGTKLLPLFVDAKKVNSPAATKTESTTSQRKKATTQPNLTSDNVKKTRNYPKGTKNKKIDLATGMPVENENIIYIPLKTRPALNGELLLDAQVNQNMGSYIVTFRLNNLGAKIFANVTAQNIGHILAIVLDDEVISAPSIREAIPAGNGSISGNFTLESATELALLLRSGALPTRLEVIEERNLGPSLGQASIESGAWAALIGAVAVMAMMLIFYGRLGLFANAALLVNMLAILAVMAAIGATLTLPGIAGIALTLGMAVDANVLIFERMREELARGTSMIKAVSSGYNMAFITIFDANFTTIAAAVILYIFGSSAVKGFAVTLIIGIACSMYTAVQLSKIMMHFWLRWAKPHSLSLQ